MRDRSAPGTRGLLLGYARVSTDAQDLINQREQLAAAGCLRIFAEKRRDRSELARLLDPLRPGAIPRDLLNIAEFERELIRERTKHGREAAKARA